ncbi:MAG: hypothetical protein ACRCY8_12130, partial [Dermatophilaceae bacterium]
AVSGILSGLLIAVPGILDGWFGESAPTSLLLSLAPALAVPLVVGLYARQAGPAGSFGILAYAVNLIGTGLFAGVAFSLNAILFFLDAATVTELRSGVSGTALSGGGIVFVVGAALFGASMIRARVHHRVAAWAYTVAVPGLALTARLPESIVTAAVHATVGASMVTLALGLWSASSAEVAADAPNDRLARA